MSEKNLFHLILADLVSSSVSHLFQAPSVTDGKRKYHHPRKLLLQNKINVPNSLDKSLSVSMGYWGKLNGSFRLGTWFWDKWIKKRLIPTCTAWEQSYAIAHWSRPGFNEIYKLKVEARLIQVINKAKSFKNRINVINSCIDLLDNAVALSWLIILKPRFVVFP